MTWDTSKPAGSDTVSTGDDVIKEFKIDVQTALQNEGAFPVNVSTPEFHPRGGKGALSSRPVAANGGLWFDTDNSVLTRSTGSAWEQVGSMGVGTQTSSNSGSITTSSASLVDMTNLTVTLTCVGRPVLLMLVSLRTIITGANIGIVQSGSATQSISGTIAFLKDGTVISAQSLNLQETASSTGFALSIPVSSFQHIDIPTVGSHTYKMQWGVAVAASSQLQTNNVALMAVEL